MIQSLVHYSLHFILPLAIGFYFFPEKKWKVCFLLWATMLVDLDHLLAEPIFDPGRCSIGFHPLHSYPAIVVYSMGIFHPKTRIIALGLILHMLTDGLDCIWTRLG